MLPPTIVNLIVILIVALIAAAIIAYLIRAKKRGQVCIGCSQATTCVKCREGACSCTPKKGTDDSNPTR